MTNRLILASVVTIVAAVSTSGQTLSAEDSLKATHETLMQAVTAANADRVAALIHPRALGFFRMSQQVAELEGGSSRRTLVETLLRDLGEFTASQQSLTTRLRVVDDTGIVTQTARRESVAGKKKVIRDLRTTGVYVRSADGWRLVSWHTSDVPLSK
jgi:ketosteroid isomerase-like protein